MPTLKSLSDDFAALVNTAAPSVVQVDARKRYPATGIVWSADGLILTAAHVVTREEQIRVGLPEGSRVSAAIVGHDPYTDLALLRAEASGLQPAAWIGDDDLRVGELVLALGRPEADMQATLGVISALGDAWRAPTGARIERYVQTDVTMYPGFSGGPLVTASGAFAGLNTSALLGEGVSLTLHAAVLRRVVTAIQEHGGVQRGYLGIGSQPVRLPDDLAQQVGQETGLLLVSVEPDSPAGRAGLLLGDVLTALAGDPVRHMDDLYAVLSAGHVGQTVPAAIVRGGQRMQVQVTIGERK